MFLIKKLKNFIEPTLIIIAAILSAFLISQFDLFSLDINIEKKIFPVSEIPEIIAIKSTQDLKEQIKLYTELIGRVGVVGAQEYLFRSGLPFTGQTHLLNHTAGDYLYDKNGPAGLVECKDYFLSSCYHGFILNAIAEGGMSEVAKTFAECRRQGKTVSSQCAHAIGHGFLANAGYKNLTRALKTCDEAVNTMTEFPAFNCYDGIFMENIWAVHNGEPSPDRWVKSNDPVYPCNDEKINDKYMLGCWSNQPALAYQLFKGNIKKVADEICSNIKNTEHQRMCFDGLARQIHPLTKGEPEKTIELCELMPSTGWVDFCVSVNAEASYSVGDRDVPFKTCALASKDGESSCYNRLFSSMGAYKKPGEDLNGLCKKITEPDWRRKCKNLY